MTSNNDEALNFYGYSSYEQLEQALLEKDMVWMMYQCGLTV